MDHRVEAANCGAAAHGWVQVSTADVGGDIDPHGQREAIYLDYPTTASGLLLVLRFNMIMDPKNQDRNRVLLGAQSQKEQSWERKFRQ